MQATFKAPYIAHAQIEPMTALVSIQADGAEVWTSTQNPFGVRSAVAQALNLSNDAVIVYPLMSGGAFGRKSIADEVTLEAARLAKAFGRPVRVNWTRPEEFQFDHFRPAMLRSSLVILRRPPAPGCSRVLESIVWTTRFPSSQVRFSP